ncbi:MAG: hypothetical protein ACFNX9_00040 [Eikenella corrodens]|uniref:hypothetical protein n=1 Tax=Eikenella corrodens TaxID=539 RepID=UPI00361CA0EC
MTHQFKFGDRVKCFPTPESIGVVLSEEDEYGYVNVMFDDALEVEDFPVSGLELIPHPDTERLDWLADPANKIGNVILPGWCSDEYNSLRDAIDAAMQEQAAEAKEQS